MHNKLNIFSLRAIPTWLFYFFEQCSKCTNTALRMLNLFLWILRQGFLQPISMDASDCALMCL